MILKKRDYLERSLRKGSLRKYVTSGKVHFEKSTVLEVTYFQSDRFQSDRFFGITHYRSDPLRN